MAQVCLLNKLPQKYFQVENKLLQVNFHDWCDGISTTVVFRRALLMCWPFPRDNKWHCVSWQIGLAGMICSFRFN